MERSEILTTMAELKLYGMKAAFDEIIGTAVKRQHEPTRIVGDLLAMSRKPIGGGPMSDAERQARCRAARAAGRRPEASAGINQHRSAEPSTGRHDGTD